MSLSLYSRLYRYPELNGRSQMENFLSEAFCDLLSRMPSEYLLKLISEVLLDEPTGDSDQLIANIAAAQPSSLIWSTQHSIYWNNQTKFPDIVLSENNTPLLIIENKIDAGFTSSIRESDEGEPGEKHQLAVYGDWLNSKNSSAGLVLLTSHSNPPNDFLEGDQNYHIKLRAVCYWNDVWKWLLKVPTMDNPTASFLLNPAHELAFFLEERNIVMKEPDKNDFDLSKKFFTSTFGRMFSMLYSIRQHLDAKGFKCIGNNPSDKSMVYREGCVISDWRWLDNNRNLYIGWGIRFSKDASDWWRPFNRLPEKPHAFVYFSYDKKPIFFSDLNLNKEIWNYVDGHKDCVTAVELEGLPKGEETTSQAAIKWIVRNVIEAKSLLRNAER